MSVTGVTMEAGKGKMSPKIITATGMITPNTVITTEEGIRKDPDTGLIMKCPEGTISRSLLFATMKTVNTGNMGRTLADTGESTKDRLIRKAKEEDGRMSFTAKTGITPTLKGMILIETAAHFHRLITGKIRDADISQGIARKGLIRNLAGKEAGI
jgi:hypothetical protein